MASNLKRSKRTVGKRIDDLHRRVLHMQKRPSPRRIGSRVIVTTNLTQDAVTNVELAPDSVTAETIVAGTITSTELAEDAGGADTAFTPTAPANPVVGDLWFDSSDSVTLKRWSGSAWVSMRDLGIAAAAAGAAAADAAAVAAQTTADGKNKVYRDPTEPSGGTYTDGDLWFDTDDNNKVYRRTGSAWTAVVLGGNAIANIDAGSITAGTIAAGRISTSSLTSANIDAARITAGVISSDRITSASIAAGVITADKITAGTLTGVTVNATVGNIGGFVIGPSVLTSDYSDNGSFDTIDATLSLGQNAQIFTRWENYIIAAGVTIFTEIYLNKVDDQGGIVLTGNFSGSTQTTKVRPAFVVSPEFVAGASDFSGTLTRVTNDVSSFGGLIRTASNSAATPAYSFNGDTNTGMYRVSENVIGFSSGGAQSARLGANLTLIGDISSVVNITATGTVAGDAVTAGSATVTGELLIGGKLNANGQVEFDKGNASAGATTVSQTTNSTVGVICFANGSLGSGGASVANQAVFWRSSSGMTVTSSLKLKENIIPLLETESDLSNFWTLNTVEYEYKNEHGGYAEKLRPYNHRRRYGFIAEDIEEKMPYLSSYDDNSEVDSYKLDSLVTLLYEETRKMRQYMIDNYNYPG